MTLTPERWQQIARIYELAVDCDPATLDSFLSEACAGDEGLRREVESLLQQEGARVVLDRPVWATAAPLFDASLTFTRGRRSVHTASKVVSVPAAWAKSSAAPTPASAAE